MFFKKRKGLYYISTEFFWTEANIYFFFKTIRGLDQSEYMCGALMPPIDVST